jgi:hypothetical protein
MPIQKIKSSNLAPDNGYPNLGILGVSTSGKPLYFRRFQQAVVAALPHSEQRQMHLRYKTHGTASQSWSIASITRLDKDI